MVISLHNEIEIVSLSIQTDRPEQIVQNLIRFIEGNQEIQVIRDSWSQINLIFLVMQQLL